MRDHDSPRRHHRLLGSEHLAHRPSRLVQSTIWTGLANQTGGSAIQKADGLRWKSTANTGTIAVGWRATIGENTITPITAIGLQRRLRPELSLTRLRRTAADTCVIRRLPHNAGAAVALSRGWRQRRRLPSTCGAAGQQAISLPGNRRQKEEQRASSLSRRENIHEPVVTRRCPLQPRLPPPHFRFHPHTGRWSDRCGPARSR